MVNKDDVTQALNDESLPRRYISKKLGKNVRNLWSAEEQQTLQDVHRCHRVLVWLGAALPPVPVHPGAVPGDAVDGPRRPPNAGRAAPSGL